jgi:fido (protein-threonine AMPylation protein)
MGCANSKLRRDAHEDTTKELRKQLDAKDKQLDAKDKQLDAKDAELACFREQGSRVGNSVWMLKAMNNKRWYYESFEERFKAHVAFAFEDDERTMEIVHGLTHTLELSEWHARRTVLNDREKRDLLTWYVKELWLSELPPPSSVDTVKLLNYVPNDEQAFKRELSGMLPNSDEQTTANWWVIVRNLYTASDKWLFQPAAPDVLTVQGLKALHGDAMSGVIDKYGILRTFDVSPARSSVSYANHRKIDQYLKTLCEEAKKGFEQVNQVPDKTLRLQRAVALAAVVFSSLLWIHPFEDGNGRSSRLALSVLLREYTAVPISLYIRHGSRDEYITALEESHLDTDVPPWRVMNYVLHAAISSKCASV